MLLHPVPAITGIRFAVFSIVNFMTFRFSSGVSVADSPVVPQVMIASVPFFI